MNTTLEFFVVFAVAILPQMIGSFLSIKDKEYFRKFTPEQRTVSTLGRWIGIILLLFYIATNHSDGLSSIGLGYVKDDLPKTILVGGITSGYLASVFVLLKLRSKKIQEQTETLRRSIFATGAFSAHKGFWGRSVYLLSLWLGVTAEDLVFRGYLVLGLGARTGNYFLWIVLSIVLSIAAHLYQGVSWRLMVGQGLFALIFIAVSLITNNVITAIIPHLVYDTIWVLRGWAKDSKAETRQPL